MFFLLNAVHALSTDAIGGNICAYVCVCMCVRARMAVAEKKAVQ